MRESCYSIGSTYKSVCKTYGISVTDCNGKTNFYSLSVSELEDIKRKMRARILEIDKIIDAKMGSKKTKISETFKDDIYKSLTNLSDEQYNINIVLNDITDELIKRRRTNFVSQKALNHGGIYTTGDLKLSTCNGKYRPISGVCL